LQAVQRGLQLFQLFQRSGFVRKNGGRAGLQIQRVFMASERFREAAQFMQQVALVGPGGAMLRRHGKRLAVTVQRLLAPPQLAQYRAAVGPGGRVGFAMRDELFILGQCRVMLRGFVQCARQVQTQCAVMR
jgi:hypothetical protein